MYVLYIVKMARWYTKITVDFHFILSCVHAMNEWADWWADAASKFYSQTAGGSVIDYLKQ